MIRYTLCVLLLIVVALVVEQFVPAFTGLYGSRLLLVALVFLCASVTVPAPMMLLLAFFCGLLTDAQNTLGPHGGDPEVYQPAVQPLRFGYSILLYGVIGFLMQGIQPLFRQGKWQYSALLSGVAVFVYLSAEYLLINFVRGGFEFSEPTLLKIFFSAGLTMLFSPLVFALLFRIADACRYVIRFDGLKKKRRPTLIS